MLKHLRREPDVAKVEERGAGALVFGDEFEGFLVTGCHFDAK